MEEEKIVYKKVSELHLNEKNPRKNDGAVETVAKSIKEFGFKNPLIVDSDGKVWCGNTRLKASIQLGLEKVPCIVADDLTEEQIRKLALIDNKSNEIAEWDMNLLTEELIDLDMSDFDLDWGIIEEEKKEIEEDNFDVEEAIPEEPKSKLGEIYQLGEHRLMCGDSTKEEDVGKLLDNNEIDVAFTSPPYNVGKSSILNGNTHMKSSKYKHSGDNLIDYSRLLEITTNNAINNSKYAFINLQMLSNNKIEVIDYLSKFKNKLCDIAIWNKGFGAPAMARKVMNSAFEFIFAFSKDNNSRSIGTKDFRGTVSNVIELPPQRNNEFSEIHGATFPIKFVSHFIENFSNKNDKIMDLFGGTGTTLIACEQLNRKCYMMEIDPLYVDVIIKRWEDFTGKKAIKLN